MPFMDSLPPNNTHSLLPPTQVGNAQLKRKRSGLDEGEFNTNSCAESSTAQKLCQRCKNIDFQAIFDTPKSIPPLNGLPVLDLGDLETSAEECSLCYLFASVRLPKVSGSRKKGFHLRLTSSLSILGKKKRKKERPSVALSVVHGPILHKEINPWERIEQLDRGFIVPAFDHNALTSFQPTFQGHQVSPKLGELYPDRGVVESLPRISFRIMWSERFITAFPTEMYRLFH
jgi:hypothetical protein